MKKFSIAFSSVWFSVCLAEAWPWSLRFRLTTLKIWLCADCVITPGQWERTEAARCIVQQGACFMLIASVAVGLSWTRHPPRTDAVGRRQLSPADSHFARPVSSSPRCVPSSVPLLSSSRSPPHRSHFIFMLSNRPAASASHSVPCETGAQAHPCIQTTHGSGCGARSQQKPQKMKEKQRDVEAATFLWIAAAIIMFWGRIRAIKLYLLSSCIWKSNVDRVFIVGWCNLSPGQISD